MGYLDIDMPDSFILEGKAGDGSWLDWGLFPRDMFVRDEDGTYICAGHGGSPVFLRCIAQHADAVIECVDGSGTSHMYRLRPMPS